MSQTNLLAACSLLLPALLVTGDSKKDTGLAQKASSDWPIFRGNSLQTGMAGSPLPDKLVVRWKFKAKDAIEGTAAIVNGIVYIGSMDGNLYALDLATGKA